MAAAAYSRKADEVDADPVEDDIEECSLSSEEREMAKDLLSQRSQVPLAERNHSRVDKQHSEVAPFRLSRDASYTRCHNLSTRLQASDCATADPLYDAEEGLQLGYANVQQISALQRAPTIEPLWPPHGGMDMGNIYRNSDCSQASARERLASQRKAPGANVVLRVYDLADVTRRTGLPIFHLGVEVYRREYYYSSKGITYCNPCRKYGERRGKAKPRGICYCWCHALFREGVPLGRTKLSRREVLQVVHDLCRDEWQAEAYSPLGQNCQTFAVKFCERLGLPEGCIPAKYSRFAELEDFQSTVHNVTSSLMECDVFCRSCAVEKKPPAYEIAMQPMYDEHQAMHPLSVKARFGGA